MKEPRDSQRSRVYAAERECDALKREADHLPQVKDLERFVKQVLQSKWLVGLYPRLGRAIIYVKDGRRCRSAYGCYQYINMPKWSRYKLVALHELCHSFLARLCRNVAAHGWEFAELYVKLVQHFLGVADARQLKEAFRKHHVRFRPKRKGKPRPISAKALEGLKRWRERRKQQQSTPKTEGQTSGTETCLSRLA